MQRGARLLLVGVLPLVVSGSAGCTHYVSFANGSDEASCPGTLTAPFKTLAHAVATVARTAHSQARTICLRSDGTHYLSSTVVIDASASSLSSPLTIQAYPPDLEQFGQRPVLSGGIPVNGFTKRRGSTGKDDHAVWVAPVPQHAQRPSLMFGTDGSWLQRARIPKRAVSGSSSRYFDDASTFHWAAPLVPGPGGTLPASDRMGFQYNGSDDVPAHMYRPSEVQVLHFGAWTAFWGNLSEVNTANKSILLAEPAPQPIGQYEVQGGRRFVMENVREGLEEPGEWYWDEAAGEVLLITDTLDGAPEAIAPQLPVLLHVTGGATHLTLADVELRHSSVGERVNTYYSAMAAVLMQNASDILFVRTLVACCGASGFLVQSQVQRLSIIDSAVMGVGGDGIGVMSSAGVRELLVNNTLVNDTGKVIMGQPGGIRVKGESGITITHNTVSFCPYAGIMLGWQTGGPPDENAVPIFSIGHNLVHDYGLGVLSDFGGIYLSTNDNLCFEKSPQTCWIPSLVHNNVIHSCRRYNYGCEGIYMDEQVSGVVMSNNTIYSVQDQGVYFHCGTDNKFINNIIASAGTGGTTIAQKLHPGLCNKGGNPTWPDVIHGFEFSRNIVLIDDSIVTLPDRPTQDDVRNTTFANNLYFAVTNSTLSDLGTGPVWPNGATWTHWQLQDKGSLLQDPLFEDWREHDYRLKPNSPAFRLGFVPWDTVAGCSTNPLISSDKLN